MTDEGPATAPRRTAPPVAVPQGGGPWFGGRSHRRRRSATPLPPPPIPVEMPDDTMGRVAFLSVEPPPDVCPEAAPVPAGPPAAPPRRPLLGWVAAAVVALAIVAVFVLGMGLLR
jgi:hypothetical protein